jgi:excisionase family DNA binding protein
VSTPETVLLTRRPRRRRAPGVMFDLKTALPPDPEPAGDVLTLAQAAQVCQVSAGTILRWVRDDGLPSRGSGRVRRISREALLAWLAGRDG